MTFEGAEARPPPRILCLRDREGDDSIAEVLDREGRYQTIRAARFQEFLDTDPISAPIDLIVLDLVDREASLEQVVQELRSHRATASAGILGVTHEDDSRGGFAHFAPRLDAYVPRPVDARVLLAQVDALLRIRRAEQQARDLARDWRVTFDAITDAIFVVGRRGRVVQCNRAALRMLGRPRDDVVGRHYREVWNDSSGGLPEELSSMASATEPLATEICRGDRWYRLLADPIDSARDATARDVVFILTDITELKRYEHELRVQAEELQQHNRRQTEFLGLLAHELRNPLAAISAAAEVIEEGDAQVERGDLGPLTIVRRQVGHLARMVSDLLDLSRITEGKIDLRCEPVDLRECVRSAVAAARPAAEAARHVLEVHAGTVPLVAKIDRTRIEQMLANLLDNAIKYTQPGGCIEVGLAPDPRESQTRARLYVRDTGVGIPADRLHQAFDMFVQYERTLDRAQGGLGLGLTLVKRLVELHGGDVIAHSPGVGHGTTFDVRLPLHRETRASSVRPPGRSSRSPAKTVCRILVVEDNDDLRRLLAWKLRRDGHDVSEARTGPEGRKRALNERPDTVVLDVGLPGLDGYALARELRANEATQDCYLIALTGYGSERDRRGACEAGFDVHLVKPVDFDELSTLVGRGSG